MPKTPLPGDLVVLALRLDPLPDRERVSPSLDPQSLAEFLAYDIPFDIEPVTGFGFPAGTDRG